MTREQFEQSLKNPVSFWGSKTKNEVGALMGESVSAMVAFDQRNPHHCYDLFTHSLHTVEGIKETASTLLWTAAFFHDIGKPAVAMEKQGRIVYYGHAQKSAEMVDPLLIGLGYTEAERKEIVFYIKHHDDFISWILPEEAQDDDHKSFVQITEKNMQRHMDRVKKKDPDTGFQPDLQNWENLLELCYADASAQADVVIQNGVVIDTKEHKLKKIRALQNIHSLDMKMEMRK